MFPKKPVYFAIKAAGRHFPNCGNDFAAWKKTILISRFFMKQLFLTAFASLFFLVGNQAQNYQDTTFTDPVFITFANDFVTFENCRFIGIEGVALWIEGSAALISNCTFEDINGTAVFAYGSEVYLVDDTIRNAVIGIQGEFGAVIILGCQISQITTWAIKFSSIDVAEINECNIHDVGFGIDCEGLLGSSELLVVKNEMRRVQGSALTAERFLSVKVTDCKIDSCVGSGINLSASGASYSIETAELQNNVISRTNLDGIIGRAYVQHAIIQNNEVSYAGFLGGEPLNGTHLINWQGPDARIDGNHLHHTLDTACVLPYCGSGIYIQSSATITRNRIHDCNGNGIRYASNFEPGNEPLSIFNNIIYDVAGNPVRYSGSGNFPPLNEPISTLIRNNTLHSTRSAPLDISVTLSFSISAEGNILLFEGEADTSKYIQISGGGVLLENLNLKASGDLDFVDFAGRDFHLASENSPAHNFLPLNFGLPNDDFDGDLRLGLRDAGADEIASDVVICGCNNCPNEIPDLFFADFTFAVVSADKNDLSGSEQGVCGVRVEFEHDYIGDVRMDLISPSGQSVHLVGPNGFWGASDLTTWNVGFVRCDNPASPDPGFSAVWNSNQTWGEGASYSGVYYPATGCLEDFNLGPITGDWTLRVSDNQVNDMGTVKGFEVMFCDMSGVSCFVCSEPPTAQVTATPVGAWAFSFSNLSTSGLTDLTLDFGDGQSQNGAFFQAFHEYENAGSYLVRLIATNECGVDTFSQIVQVAGTLPVAFAFAEPIVGCSPLEVQTVVISADHVDTWHWLFPGGMPSESFEMEPAVTYTAQGAHFATLILENEVGSVTIDTIFTVFVQPALINPSFDVQVLGDSIVCTNTTQNVLFYQWTLNGGSPVGINASPFVFEVDASGTYTVGLSLSGVCDSIFLTEEVPVIIVSNKNLADEDWRFSISPNPNDGQFRLGIDAAENLPADLTVLNALGVVVSTRKIALAKGTNQFDFDLSTMPAGVYYLQIQTAKGRANIKLVIGE
ncbi:MAG: right-handed parallel beta-helix repeat-containing protein [Saprospiraceae bacterium]|nr:right-handed parallel beta-helix repeat-containing protein [Saprospiraceae bacterium]